MASIIVASRVVAFARTASPIAGPYRRRCPDVQGLFGVPSTCRPKIAEGGMLPALRGRGDAGDLGPKLESPGACGSVFGGGDVIAAERKEVVDLIMSREKPLCLAG
jgi:hypothetical protein